MGISKQQILCLFKGYSGHGTLIAVAQFFSTVSGFTISAGNFVKYPFTLFVNRYFFHMLSLVNAWVKPLCLMVLKFPLHALNIIYKRIK